MQPRSRRRRTPEKGTSRITLAMSIAMAAGITLAVIASGGRTAPHAIAAASVNLDQCANQATPCAWQNGNLNGNNSAYAEGKVVPFRLALEGLSTGTHSIHINYDFTAGDLKVAHCSNLTFADLSPSRQRKIKNRSIRGIVLNEDADEAARLDMFERINTGSKIANHAEIRRGALAGPFLDLVIELATNEIFKKVAPMSEKRRKEREAEELITRFFAYGDGLEGYRDRPADFIFDYSKKMNAAFSVDPSLREEYDARFMQMVSFVARVFPNGFRRSTGGQATPRARFEALAIGSFRALAERPSLLTAPGAEIDVAAWMDSDEFSNITGSDGANAVARLERRINFVRDWLLAA